MVELEQLLHDNPHKKLLVRALELKHATNFDSVVDLFLNEMLLTGLHQSLPPPSPYISSNLVQKVHASPSSTSFMSWHEKPSKWSPSRLVALLAH